MRWWWHICDLETIKPQEIPISKVCVMFYNIKICYQSCGEKKASFLAIVLCTQMYGCKLINGGGTIYFVILMWEWY